MAYAGRSLVLSDGYRAAFEPAFTYSASSSSNHLRSLEGAPPGLVGGVTASARRAASAAWTGLPFNEYASARYPRAAGFLPFASWSARNAKRSAAG